MQGLTYLMMACWALSVSFVCLGTWLTGRNFKKITASKVKHPVKLLEPLTLLKPVKGLEEGMEANLESFFNLDYPEFEILFSVAETEDPAIPLIKRVIQRHPDVSAKLIVGDIPIGPNPKVNNMVRGYQLAQYDWILISDSNIRARPTYLKDLMESTGPKTGLLTAAVVGDQAKGLGGHMEAHHLNSFVARCMKMGDSLGHPLVLGKSMLFRRSVMERIGGLKTLGQFLAEDYMAGRAMKKLGLQIKLMGQPVQQYLGNYSLRNFWSRHLRWGRIRKSHNRLVFFLEPFFSALGSGLIGAYSLGPILDLSTTKFLGFHLSAWSLMDLWIHWRLGIRPKVFAPLSWILKEIFILLLWVHTLLGNQIRWRGNRYRLLPGGRLA